MTTKKQIKISLAATGAFVLLLAAIKFFQISAAIAEGKSRGQPPVAVTSIKAEKEQWPVTFRAVGTLSPVQGVILAAEEGGRVAKVFFESGQKVKAGDVLVELDLTVEEAQLKSALAQEELARTNAKRQRALRARNVNSQADLDDAENSLEHATSEVERIKAIIQRKRIVAPFDGIAGIRLVNVGETIVVTAPVVSVQSLDTLYVDFDLPQGSVGKIAIASDVEIKVDAFPETTFKGKLTAIDSTVDSVSRNIKMQAVVPNGAHRLLPGMFADITITLPETEDVVSIPASSISYAPYGDSVFLVKPVEGEEKDQLPTAVQQVVKIGRRMGDKIAIVSGLNGGEEVVSSGTFRIMPGASLIVNNSVMPGNEAAPTPADT